MRSLHISGLHPSLITATLVNEVEGCLAAVVAVVVAVVVVGVATVGRGLYVYIFIQIERKCIGKSLKYNLQIDWTSSHKGV